MPLPLSNNSWAVTAATAAVLTGCEAPSGAAAAGTGLAVLGVCTAAWAIHRRWTRLRGGTSDHQSQATMPAAAAETARFRIRTRREVERLQAKLAAPDVSKSTAERVFAILCLQGLIHPDEEVLQAAGSALLKGVSMRPERAGHHLVDQLGEVLKRQIRPLGGAWCCQTLLKIALSRAEDPVAAHAIDMIGYAGLSHRLEKVAEKSAGCLEILAQRGDPRLLTPETVARLRLEGLKPSRSFATCIRTLFALEAIAENGSLSASRTAMDVLALEGLNHPHTGVATAAAERIQELANRRHERIPMLPLVALRSRGFSSHSPRELTEAFVEALALIAAPAGCLPGEDQKISEKALQILFEDGLVHPDPEIAHLVTLKLRETLTRRPELFSSDLI